MSENNIQQIPQEFYEAIKPFDKEEYHDLEKYYSDIEDKMSIDTVKKKYFAPWEKSLFDMWIRLAWGCAQAEKEENRIEWAVKFFSILADFTFLPGGRINFGLGRTDICVSLSNCYINPIKEDSLLGIYQCLVEEALTYKTGGGCGHDLSVLRPYGKSINGTGGESCGPVGFMNLYSQSTATVRQKERRGANLQSLDVSHPDIERFITRKNDASEAQEVLKKLLELYPKNKKDFVVLKDFIESHRDVQNSNVSVKLYDEFMNAMQNNSDYNLRWGGETYNVIKAKDLWQKIIHNAWESAEPGLFFWDRIIENYNLQYINPVICTNPCGEIPGGAYANCLLAHQNLQRFVKYSTRKQKWFFDIDAFKDSIRIGVRFMDNIITLNDGKHALPEQNAVALNERRIGMGITGYGDMLVMLGLRYGSKEALEKTEEVMKAMRNTAYEASCDLAIERGSFPWFDAEGMFRSKFMQALPPSLQTKVKTTGIRNGTLLTSAPVGTGSIIAKVSGGIEPIFNVKPYTRKIKEDDGITNKKYKVYHPLLKLMFGEIEEYPDYVVDSTMLTPVERVTTQATIQKYIDNSISSTVNLPKDATEEQVAEIYTLAWKTGCKGITVYRAGTRDGVLISEDDDVVVDEDSERYTLKRPAKLEAETFKIKMDINENVHNCYVTISFFPGTKQPYEVLLTEPHVDKDHKDIVMLETTTRMTSLLLRHKVPLKFVVQQLEKINGQYLYSAPFIVAKVLRNYLVEIDKESGESNTGNICTNCGGKNVKYEGGCDICPDCLFSKGCG